MTPNLARIPADGDTRAEAILRRASGPITQPLVDSLDERDALALGRYGARQVTVALRQQSAEHLRRALLAVALARLVRPADPRDTMIGLALHHVAAQRIGVDAAALFDSVAADLPEGPIPELLRVFGAIRDIPPEAFGWELVQTAEGPDFVPA